ncbi:DUF3267 domain-containing protein [Thalassobacillus pellis]|uniref:DUF3267 domain-containing protein n=1 Tax=Thalassobacillus pellis TaxID=748008 RepID=UPI0019604102|nr:DUF3267 domain-containing protein [Thalassobacillus pellis]MBM7554127.1 hypothetical protein [Thalassobacillus pellis]
MNCWKTVNITKDFGNNRVYLISFLTGLMAFLILYLAFSMMHLTHDVKDHGFIPLLIILFFLPSIHRMMHLLPLILLYKRLKVKWKMNKWLLPTFAYRCQSKLSKQTSIFMAFAPTLFLTLPGIAMSYIFPNYFAYFVIFTAVNIGLSFTDFLYLNQFLRAPRKCIIENAKDGYDILIKQKK